MFFWLANQPYKNYNPLQVFSPAWPDQSDETALVAHPIRITTPPSIHHSTAKTSSTMSLSYLFLRLTFISAAAVGGFTAGGPPSVAKISRSSVATTAPLVVEQHAASNDHSPVAPAWRDATALYESFAACDDPELAPQLRSALSILLDAFRLYGPDGVVCRCAANCAPCALTKH